MYHYTSFFDTISSCGFMRTYDYFRKVGDRWEQNMVILFTHMLPALESKKNEFHFYGYTTMTKEDIWIYCVRKKWRKKDVSSMRTYEIANDILRILPAAFMTYTQIEAQRDSDWFSDLNSDELQILLSPKKNQDDQKINK